MAKRVTKRQQEVLGFIRDFTNKHGHSPTYQEIADGMRFRVYAAWCHICSLEAKGLIERIEFIPRSIKLTPVAESIQ